MVFEVPWKNRYFHFKKGNIDSSRGVEPSKNSSFSRVPKGTSRKVPQPRVVGEYSGGCAHERLKNGEDGLDQGKDEYILLIAEDDEEDRLILEEASREAGITLPIHCVENGEELFDFLGKRNKFSDRPETLKPLLILLDLNMPKLDGRQALEALKKEDRYKEIPVIVFTTSNTRNEISRAYQSGASSFIIKPFSFRTLVDMMKVIKHYWLETVELP